ncbi:MAG: cobalamin biosynthesis protein CobW [Azospirillum sp.]|nr:cobalamin biosynthesis protein CobW [Azospirillum sp.]
MASKIPATVVTGFLGAGKTSLIRHLIEHAAGRRLALVINEFGDLGVDRELIAGCGVEGCRDADIVELTNGCICCTVADDFLPTIEQLLSRDQPPDHIVIETSGLALPKPLVKAFAWPEIRTRVTVDGVIAVIDAAAVAAGRFATDPAALAAARAEDPSLDHESPLEELFEEQIQCADMVILNKSDLVDDRSLAEVARAVALHLRPAVKAVPAVAGALDPRIVLGLAAAAEEDLASRPSHHDNEGLAHDHDDFDSFVVPLGPLDSPDTLVERLKAAAARHDILRIKGFLAIEGKPMRHVIQAVGSRIQNYYDRPWRADELRRSALVVIGQKGLDRDAITAALCEGAAVALPPQA